MMWFLLNHALGTEQYARTEIAREATGLTCETPGCVTSDVAVLVEFPSPQHLTLCLCVEHQPPGRPPHLSVRASTSPVAVEHREALIAGGLQIWEADRPLRERIRDRLRAELAGSKSLGLN